MRKRSVADIVEQSKQRNVRRFFGGKKSLLAHFVAKLKSFGVNAESMFKSVVRCPRKYGQRRSQLGNMQKPLVQRMMDNGRYFSYINTFAWRYSDVFFIKLVHRVILT